MDKESKTIKTAALIKLLCAIVIIVAVITIICMNDTVKIKVFDKNTRVKTSEITEQVPSYDIGVNDETINLSKYAEELVVSKDNKSIYLMNTDDKLNIKYLIIDKSNNSIVETDFIEPLTQLEWNAYKSLNKMDEKNVETTWIIQVVDSNYKTVFSTNTIVNITIDK